ncbi:MAG: NfeD family protein [Oscillospiraceae bacterium]|nr:NfeD family protein [Oscillospiraceae bacterium]
MQTWIIWLVLMLAALALETLSLQLFSIWFALGALVSLIVSLVMPEPFWPQPLLFVLVTLVSLLATRPLVRRLSRGYQPSNADRYVGKTGLVLEEINNARGTGQVKVEGSVWSARSAAGELIPANAAIKAEAISGAKLVVSLLEEREPLAAK